MSAGKSATRGNFRMDRSSFTYRFVWVVTLVVLSAGVSRVRAVDRKLFDAVPADAMAVLEIDHNPSTSRHVATLSMLAAVFERVQSTGLVKLDSKRRIVLDITASLPILFEHSLVAVLLDVTAKRRGAQSYQLDTLNIALVLHTKGQNEKLVRRVQHFLTGYTNTDDDEVLTLEKGPYKYYRLVHRRFPAWAVFEWAPTEDYFVLGFGKGSLNRILNTLEKKDSLGADPWFQSACRQASANQAQALWMVDFWRIKSRLSEVIAGRPKHVIGALHAANIQRALWTLTTRDRAVGCEAILKFPKGDEHVIIADINEDDPDVLRVVPAGARIYASIRCDVSAWINRARDAYMAARGRVTRGSITKGWARIEKELGVDAEADLIDQFGQNIVVHTYPPHPLGIPLLCTILVKIDGDPERVRATLDSLLRKYHDHLKQVSVGEHCVFTPVVRHAADGVWFFQIGVYGPAVAVEKDWLIIGFSPAAVRKNIEYLRSLDRPATTQSATPTAVPIDKP